MIISRISGGLGNQMFEYAMGKALALRNHTELFLDLSFFNKDSADTHRTFLLDKFNTDIRVATKKEYRQSGLPDMISHSILAKARRKLFRMIESRKPLSKRKFVVEHSFIFNAEACHLSNAYLSGVWQSEKYFADCAETIRQEFTLKDLLSPSGQQVLRAIESKSASASIHIRRGDYVSDAKIQAKIGTCPPEYYVRAINFLLAKIPDITFFVFSDDMIYAKNAFTIPGNPVFVSSPEISDYEELFLMSKCAHNIIANSSFSWWAAWLNGNPAKTVLAPKIWFKSDISTTDLIPSSWLRL